MKISIEVFKDPFAVEREIGIVTKQLINEGGGAAASRVLAIKKVSKIQYTQVITTIESTKEIDPWKVAHDIVGGVNFKMTTSK